MGNQCLGINNDYSLHCIPSSRKPFSGNCLLKKKPLNIELTEEMFKKIFPDRAP